MSGSSMKVAVNPLPWVLTESGWSLTREVLTEALTDLRKVGFTALHAEVPEDMTVQEYRRTLADFGFEPAPGYFSADFATSERAPDLLEAARRAARVQAELGLTHVFIASEIASPRWECPAVGYLSDDERLKLVTEGLVAAAEVMREEGVTAAMHPHVGTWVETDAEVRSVLDSSQGSALGFGPDTGHLFWAGADPARLVADYGGRVACLHIKDVDASAAAAAREHADDYMGATFGRHIWTEPGRGSVDLEAVIDALPEGFDGWAVLEVDVPNLPSRVESARAGLEYLQAHPAFAVAAS
jgi:inosose dehydratase